MFGLGNYTILFNKIFGTGYNSDDFLERLRVFMATKNEPLRLFSEVSPELYITLNNSRICTPLSVLWAGETT